MNRSLIVFFSVVLLSAAVVGCSESRSSAAAVSDDGQAITTDGENLTRIPVDPTLNEVRVWLCNNGNYVFDDEECGKVPAHRDLQQVIATRYSAYDIVKMERTREKWVSSYYTVYYVSLKKQVPK